MTIRQIFSCNVCGAEGENDRIELWGFTHEHDGQIVPVVDSGIHICDQCLAAVCRAVERKEQVR